jgi:hypothetical protein
MHCMWEQTTQIKNEVTAATDCKCHITQAYMQEEKCACKYSLSKIAGHTNLCIMIQR